MSELREEAERVALDALNHFYGGCIEGAPDAARAVADAVLALLPSPQVGPAPRAFDFKLAMSGVTATLLIPADATGPYSAGVGVAHQGCYVLADVSPALDSVYCSDCGLNDRVSGAWVMEQFEDPAAPVPLLPRAEPPEIEGAGSGGVW